MEYKYYKMKKSGWQNEEYYRVPQDGSDSFQYWPSDNSGWQGIYSFTTWGAWISEQNPIELSENEMNDFTNNARKDNVNDNPVRCGMKMYSKNHYPVSLWLRTKFLGTIFVATFQRSKDDLLKIYSERCILYNGHNLNVVETDFGEVFFEDSIVRIYVTDSDC